MYSIYALSNFLYSKEICCPQSGANEALWSYFNDVAGQDGQIDPDELQRCLTHSGISGNYKQFSKDTCTIMINMMDRDYSGKMGFSEFKELWNALNQWKEAFVKFDQDHSGSIEQQELQQALVTFGYNLNPQTMGVILRRYSTDGMIAFDDFVGLCVRLGSLTTQFQARDVQKSGSASLYYDDFIQIAMST